MSSGVLHRPLSSKPMVSLNIQELVEGMQLVVSMLPNQRVPMLYSVSSMLPPNVMVENDLGVFRSIVALLVDACHRTQEGFIELRIGSRTSYNTHGKSQSLHVEVEATAPSVAIPCLKKYCSDGNLSAIDTTTESENQSCPSMHEEFCGTNVPCSHSQQCFDSNNSIAGAIDVVEFYMSQLGGTFGCKSRQCSTKSVLENAPTCGNIFWFSLPTL
jgi:hypothetical protein